MQDVVMYDRQSEVNELEKTLIEYKVQYIMFIIALCP